MPCGSSGDIWKKFWMGREEIWGSAVKVLLLGRERTLSGISLVLFVTHLHINTTASSNSESSSLKLLILRAAVLLFCRQ